jgi:hypothetical protein
MATKRHKEAQKLSMKISSQPASKLDYCSTMAAEVLPKLFSLRPSRLCGLIGALSNAIPLTQPQQPRHHRLNRNGL